MQALARKVLTLEYVAVRTPLAVLDNKVVSHLPERSFVRRSVEGCLGLLDDLANRVLWDRESARNGAPQADSAARTDAEAVDEQEFAEMQEQIADALLTDEEQRRHAGELAEADEQDLEELADLRAKHRAQELAEERRLKETEPDRMGSAAAVKKVAASKAPTRKAPAEKASAEKAPASAAKKTPAKKAPGTKAPANKAVAKKVPPTGPVSER
jgi:hypothetical protein